MRVSIDSEKLDLLANVISDKSGEAIPMTLAEMTDAVDGIQTGGDEPVLQSKTYTVDSAGTETITADSGYDGLSAVEVSVPSAYADCSYSALFVTESGSRKWKHILNAYNEDPGWTNSGTIATRTVTYNAVPNGSSVNPTESAQTIGGANYMMEGAVTVNAIPSNYVGTGITRRSSSDLTASGATVTAPAGYYESSATKTVESGEDVPVFTLIADASDEVISLTCNKTFNECLQLITAVTPKMAAVVKGYFQTLSQAQHTADYGLSGQDDYDTQHYIIYYGYIDYGIRYNADGTIVRVPGPEPETQDKIVNITPSTTAQSQTVVGDSGYLLNEVTINTAAMPAGTAGTPTATKGTVSNNSVTVTPSVTNTTGYITGGTKSGTAVSVSASELVSGTVNITSSGNTDVTNYATASVASGTATASATKGTVSNHSITVTPSVTRTAGYVTAGSANGTAVTVSASELVSGSQTITQNGTVDVTNLASVTVAVEGGGGGMTVATATTIPATASASISFTGLAGEPTSFVVTTAGDLATGASPYKTAAVVFDGTDLHGQIVTNTSNAQASYSTSFTKSYSNGTLTITGSGTNFQANQYKLIYTYGGNSANLGTAETQVGSGATSVTFTGLSAEPDYFSVIFKSNFSTSSGYQRVMSVAYDGTNTYGVAMDSGANAQSSWSYTYSNGSLTVSSTSTNNGGYFHQPGYYQLTYGVGGTIEPAEITVEPLSVTQNGTYTAPSGTAYSPVVVNVSGGGSVHVATTTWTNNTNTVTSHQFTGLSGTPKAAFLRCTSSLTRSSSSTNYFIADIRWDGSTTGGVAGNSYRRSNGNYANVTSGYSVSTSSNSITFTSNGSSTANPGSFYNGTYELVYVY